MAAAQTRFRDPAYPFAAVNDNAGKGGPPDQCADRQAVGNIVVVAAVLDDGAAGGIPLQQRFRQGNRYYKTLGRGEGHTLRRRAAQKQTGCARRSQRGAGAGGIAAAQHRLPAADVMGKAVWFHRFTPLAKRRPRRRRGEAEKSAVPVSAECRQTAMYLT